jgi:hypothetical protein
MQVEAAAEALERIPPALVALEAAAQVAQIVMLELLAQ